jgi:hypothetical protein
MREKLIGSEKNIALTLVSILFTLARLEGTTRLLKLGTSGFWKLDEQLGWVYIPNASGWESCYGECQLKVTINRQGLRDREFPNTKSPGAQRILMLGDSTTAAMQVALEETFVKQLETHLQDLPDASEWEVLNGSVNAYGTDNELLFYRLEGCRYQPDIVFLNVYLALDIYNNSYPLETRFGEQDHKPYFELDENGELVLNNFPVQNAETIGSRIGTILKKNFQLPRSVAQTLNLRGDVPDWMRSILNLLSGSRGADRATNEGGGDNQGTQSAAVGPVWRPDICNPEYLPVVAEAWDITKAIVHQMHAEVEESGAEFAVLLIPAAPQIVPPAQPDGEWYCDQPNLEMTTFLEEAEIPYFGYAARISRARPGK